MQDKNGTDIYDGDYISFTDPPNYMEYEDGVRKQDFKGCVELGYNGALVVPLHSGGVHLLSDLTNPDKDIGDNTVIVIGNKFENKELLNAKAD